MVQSLKSIISCITALLKNTSWEFAYVQFIPRMEALSNLTLDNWLKPAAGGDSVISYYGAAGSHFPTASLLCAGFLLLQLGFSDVIEPQLSFRQNKHKPLVLLLLLHHLFMLQTASSGSRKDDTASADSRLVQGQSSGAQKRQESKADHIWAKAKSEVLKLHF